MDAETIKTIAILLIVGIGAIWKALKYQKRIRQIEDTPRSKAQSAAQGLAEFEGFAWPSQKCVETLEKKQAVYYTFKLQKEETRGSGKNKRKEWVTVYSKHLLPEFFLCDATGLVKVEAWQAEFEMIKENTKLWSSLKNDEKNHVLEKFIDQSIPSFPPSTTLWGLFASKFRVVESYIVQGHPVHITGDFKTLEVDKTQIQSAGLTKFHQMIFDANSRSVRNLTGHFDKNNDGEISQQEAMVGFTNSAAIAVQSRTNQVEKSFEIHGRLTKSEAHPLHIAGAHEAHLVKNLKFKPYYYLAGGSGSVALAIYMMIAPMQKSNSRKLASSPPAHVSQALHQNCVGGSLPSCQTLLRQQIQFQLSPQHTSYYKARACQLGDREQCL